MNFIVVGTNHKFSPIEFRERIAFLQRHLNDALSLLLETKDITGALILSTCNRVEIYATVMDVNKGWDNIKSFFSIYHEIETSRLSAYLYCYVNKNALIHLIKVASGIDSQVLGETQIFGQVKESFNKAKEANAIDPLLECIFSSAIKLAKEARNYSGISEGNTSIGSVAVDLIKDRLGSLEKKCLLLIGAGEIIELVTKYLSKEKIKTIFASSRTFNRARQLAKKIKGKAIRFDTLRDYLDKVDIIISATASPHYVLKKEYFLAQVKPLVIMDLALPRDADPQIKEFKNITLFNLEDLNLIIKENLSQKKQKALIVENIINDRIDELCQRIGFIELAQEALI